MASGHSGEIFKLKALQSGADTYLTKPLTMKALKEIFWLLNFNSLKLNYILLKNKK